MESELCCTICDQKYEVPSRTPLMLPCGHTYCSRCLQELLSSSQLFCPEDQEAVNISSIADLPKNFSLIRLLSQSSSNPNICKDHKKRLEFICMVDKAKVCGTCALFGRHKGHEVKPIEEIVNDIASKAECLMEMLQLVEQSQQTVMNDKTKNRMDSIYERYIKKKSQLEGDIREGFENLRKKLKEMELEALETINNNFKVIESHLVNVRDIPKLIDNSASLWIGKVKDKLNKVSQLSEDLNFDSYDLLGNDCTDLFQAGEKVLVELDGLKDIRLDPYEDMIGTFLVDFKKGLPKELCKINFSNNVSKSNDEVEKENAFNDNIFEQVIEGLRLKNCTEADFTCAGELGDLAGKIASYLPENEVLLRLKLIKNSISDNAAIEIFRALADNFTLQELNLSQNALSAAALDELIDMLNINTTLKDINLTGNTRMTPEYKARFAGMTSRFRKIHT